MALHGDNREHRGFAMFDSDQPMVPGSGASVWVRVRVVQPLLRGKECSSELRTPGLVVSMRSQDV